MSVRGPLFKWFGSKWLSAKLLPAPECDMIIEPYAGGAGYSLRHVEKRVILWDDNPFLQELWKWLIDVAAAKPDLVTDIPLKLPEGTDIRDIGLSRGQALLLKHWQRTNNVGNCWTISPWGNKPGQWTANTRARVADDVGAVAHWEFRKPEPEECRRATIFYDPPYQYNYRYGFPKDGFDFEALATEARHWGKNTQVIVCEARDPKTGMSPNYLPFRDFGSRITSRRKEGRNTHSKELIWISTE
jgi:hypothetical protein